MKKILLPLLIFLISFGCSEETSLKSTLEKSWISGMRINPETKSYRPNALLTLDKGRGKLSNIGQNTIDFKYKIKEDKINLLKSNLIAGSLDILHHTANELTIVNVRKDTVKMKEVLCGKASKAAISEALLYKTFRLQASSAQPSELLYFHDKVLVKFKEKEPSQSLDRGILNLLPTRFQRESWELQQYGDYTIIELKGYEDQLGYPLIGLVEQMDDQLLNIHCYIDADSRLFELVATRENKQQLEQQIVGTWTDAGSGPTLLIKADGRFEYDYKDTIVEGRWVCDDSGKIVILESGQGFLKCCSLSKRGDQILLELSETVKTSLSKKY